MASQQSFGEFIRESRSRKTGSDFSVRKVAARIGIEPSYLSKIERGQQPPPGEQTFCRLAEELGENPDALLALAGKVSGDLLEIIRDRPTAVAELLRSVRTMPTDQVSKISRQIRDGDW